MSNPKDKGHDFKVSYSYSYEEVQVKCSCGFKKRVGESIGFEEVDAMRQKHIDEAPILKSIISFENGVTMERQGINKKDASFDVVVISTPGSCECGESDCDEATEIDTVPITMFQESIETLLNVSIA